MTTRRITQVKVWKNADKTETRIYVSFGKDSGCLYLSGSKWNPKGKLEGMTEAEKDSAWQLVQAKFADGYWHTIWASELEEKTSPLVFDYKPSPVTTATPNRYGDYCIRCGGWVDVGQGELTQLTDEEDVDFLGGGKAWIVTHRFQAVCDDHIATNAAKHAADEELIAAVNASRTAILFGFTRVEPFDFSDFTETMKGIFTGEINGVRCAVEIIPSHDGPDHRFFYSANPAAAGLTPKEFGNSLADTFSNFFGD